ncbi:MAG: DUF945 family protein [Ketobacter sp.]|nr:DUF945 family protein [Ketobacter sp.]
MKKLLAYVVVIVIGVLLSFPLVSGFALERAYEKRIANMPLQAGIAVAPQSYDRGWFRSHAVVRVTLSLDQLLGDPALGQHPLDLLVESRFYHGPLLLTDIGPRLGLGYGSLSLSGSSAEGVEQTLSRWLEAAPLNLRTIIYFDQSAQTELDIAAYEMDQGQDHIRFGGANLSLRSNKALTRFDASLLVRASNVLSAGFALDMAEASGSMSYTGNSPYTMVGESVFSIPKLALTSKSMVLILENLNLNSGNQVNQGKMDYFQTLEIESIESPLPITAASWHLEFTGVSPTGLERWSDVSMQIQQQFQSGTLPTDETGEPQLTPQLEAELEQVMHALFQPGLGFAQQLDVAALGAQHHADMRLGYNGLPGGVSFADLDDPLQFLPAFNGAVNLELDEASIVGSQFADTVLPFMQQGLLLPEQGKLVLRASLEDGVMLLNGSPFPIEALLQSAMTEPAPSGDPSADPAAAP